MRVFQAFLSMEEAEQHSLAFVTLKSIGIKKMPVSSALRQMVLAFLMSLQQVDDNTRTTDCLTLKYSPSTPCKCHRKSLYPMMLA